MRQREGRWRAEQRLKVSADGKTAVDRERRIELVAAFENSLSEVAAERGGPGKARRAAGEVHVSMDGMSSYDWRLASISVGNAMSQTATRATI